jgi:uridine kinase
MSYEKEKIIIGIAGELLAGKTTAAEFYMLSIISFRVSSTRC